MEILKKITISTVNKLSGTRKDVTARKHTMRVVGICRSVAVKETPYGVGYGFRGDVTAVNENGEEFRSGVCYLPSPIDEMLYSQVKAIEEAGDKNAAVEYAFDIFVAPSDKSPVGYSYEMVPLISVEQSDPMKALMGAMPPLPVLLDAPKVDGEAEAPKSKG